MTAGEGALVLAIDTSTSLAVVALGDMTGSSLAEDSWAAGFRHGEELLERVDALLRSRSARPSDIAGFVVGTGPGAFTGLRVGLATAKGLAMATARPVSGVSSAGALLAASHAAGVPSPAALVLPAGPSDRIVVAETGDEDGEAARAPDADGEAMPSADTEVPVRLGPDDPLPVGPGVALVAVDLDGRADAAALARGRLAQAGLGPALLRLGAARLASGGDDLATLVPEYVTLPRGVARASGTVVVLGRA